MIRQAAAAALAALLLSAGPTCAQTGPTAAEIAEMRAELKRLSAIVDKWDREAAEAARASAAAAPTAQAAAAVPAAATGLAVRAGAQPRMDGTYDPAVTLGVRSVADRTALSGEVRTRETDFQLTGGNAGGNVTIQLRRVTATATGGAERSTGRRNILALTASAPTSTDPSNNAIASIDGLTGGASIKLAFTRLLVPFVNPRTDPRLAELNAAFLAACESRRSGAGAAASPEAAPIDCRVNSAQNRAKLLSAEQADAYEALLNSNNPVFSWGLNAQLGYTSLPYIEVARAEDGSIAGYGRETLERANWAIGGEMAVFPGRSTALLGSLTYARSFRKQSSGTICPAAEPRPVICTTGAIGRPEQQETLGAGAELRRQFELSERGLIRDLALAPRITFDLLSSDWAIDAPILFVPDDKGRLIGGVRLGYESVRNAQDALEGDFRAAIFVGTAFSLE